MTSSVLDSPPPERPRRALVAGIGAGAVHAVAVLAALLLGGRAIAQRVEPAVSELVEVELPAPPPEPLPSEPSVELPPPKEVIAPKPRSERVEPVPEPPQSTAEPPAAAQAGKVLAAADDVVDFGDTFVSGTGKAYAGGVTHAQGTSERAVRDVNARAGGVPGGTGTGSVATVDRSRAPALAGGHVWDCPFPPEADDAGLDHAVVSIRVHVGARGEVLSVTATSDPGNGFAREARRCAKHKRWAPGLDRNGNPEPAVAVVRVRFDR